MRLNKFFIMIVAMSGAAHAGENLLADGNLGTGPVPPWTAVPAGLSYSIIANDGQPAPSAELTTSVSGPSGQGLYQCIPTTAGKVYRLSAYIKSTSASSTTVTAVGLAALFYTGTTCNVGGTPLGLGNATTNPNLLTANVWTLLTSTPTTAPANTASALVGLGANGANSAVYTFRADSAFFGLNDVIFYGGFEND
jgi:hypothetical protein